jgi:hypothetical protein
VCLGSRDFSPFGLYFLLLFSGYPLPFLPVVLPLLEFDSLWALLRLYRGESANLGNLLYYLRISKRMRSIKHLPKVKNCLCFPRTSQKPKILVEWENSAGKITRLQAEAMPHQERRCGREDPNGEGLSLLEDVYAWSSIGVIHQVHYQETRSTGVPGRRQQPYKWKSLSFKPGPNPRKSFHHSCVIQANCFKFSGPQFPHR